MIKKLSLLSLLSIVFLTPFTAFWDWQDVINSLEKKVEQAKVKELNESFKLEKFDTKEKFETFLVDKLYDKILDSCSKKFYPRPYPILYGSVRWWETLLQNSISKDAPEDTIMHNTNSAVWWSEKVSYGKTNLQKQWVDEPEILKLSKDFIAYYDKQQWKIYIIKSPNDNWKLDINTVHILDTITVPSIIRKYNVQMFFVNNQLIVLGSRYSNNFQGDITDVVFYNIDDNWKAKFTRIYDIKWNFKHARITNWKVYIITDYSFSHIVNSICRNYIYDKTFSEKVEKLREAFKNKYKDKLYSKDVNNELQNKIDDMFEEQKKLLNKQQILNIIKDRFIQKSIDVKIDKNKKFKFHWKIYPIDIDAINPSLNNIIFLPTNFDKLDIYSLRFNLVNIIDLDKKIRWTQYVIFWNMSNGQIHMTQKSLYLVNNYYVDYPWHCPVWMYCILPYYHRWNFTLIHKLSLNWLNLDYVNSSVVSWQPINQYSMDEDLNWNFRIFTQSSYPTRKTEIFAFDKNFNLLGMINNIAPWEQFKSSRFIGDKAYLVTFKATDPLFVIDLKDLKNPRIIWELKIPWYSLYLHPYKKVWDKQYLIWIWQQAEQVHWNWSLPKNIKIDLYEINYSQKDKEWNIKVVQKYKYILWNEEKAQNGWSYTPVFDNPRTFVSYKTKNDTMNIILPVYLTEDKKQENCYTKYIWKNWKRIEDWQTCYTKIVKQPYFIWIKWLNIDENKWIQEIISKNYINLYNIDKYNSNYKYKNEDHRVSYYKLWNIIIPFEVNTKFLDIFKWEKNKTIYFDDSVFISKLPKKPEISKKPEPSKKCYYKKPPKWAITCQMYCWKRWVLDDSLKECKQIQINAACSCPWFDTKKECKKECVK